MNIPRSRQSGYGEPRPQRGERDRTTDWRAYAGARAGAFVTALGEIGQVRAWYHCDACGRGFAPCDRYLGLGGSLLSAVPRMVASAKGEVSFAVAGSLLHELAGLNLDAKTVEPHAEVRAPSTIYSGPSAHAPATARRPASGAGTSPTTARAYTIPQSVHGDYASATGSSRALQKHRLRSPQARRHALDRPPAPTPFSRCAPASSVTL